MLGKDFLPPIGALLALRVQSFSYHSQTLHDERQIRNCELFTMNDSRTLDEVSPSSELFYQLQERANNLLQELNAFETHLKSCNKDVEIRVYKRGIESEVKALRNIAKYFNTETEAHTTSKDENDQESPQLHVLKSSNLPFYESVWNVAMTCSGITALSKRVYPPANDVSSTALPPSSGARGKHMSPKGQGSKGVLVDVVADSGLEWVKVSTLSEKRLLFEIAKEGWESYVDSTEDSDDNSNNNLIPTVDKSTRELELVRMARELQVASKGVRVHFKHPRVRVVLPKIHEGLSEDVDAFVTDLRATGAIVDCGLSLSSGAACLVRLVPTLTPWQMTEIINLDCTILLAMISDISHFRRNQMSPTAHALSGTYHMAIIRQIESEESEPMIINDIYPIVNQRVLHCTSHAAQRMREIVQCMGTLSEKRRADIILGEGGDVSRSPQELRQSFGEQSIHAVPPELQLPIKVIDFESHFLSSGVDESNQHTNSYLASVASRSVKKVNLTTINSSVFLYGWMQHILTFTSNRAVALGLLKAVNEVLDQDEHTGIIESEEQENFSGPQIFICETARSLVGKVKTKHNKG